MRPTLLRTTYRLRTACPAPRMVKTCMVHSHAEGA
eukprot:SAG11_NODE_26746_length_341_cov_0.855372_1_plen_34_part_01